MVLSHGGSCQSSRNLIWFKHLSLLFHGVLITSLHSTGGLSLCSKKRQNNSDIRKQQTRYLKKSHKFGVELPKTVEHALALNTKNGNTIWADKISKELENVGVAFGILPDTKKPQ